MHTKITILCLFIVGLIAGCASLQERRAFKIKSYVKVFSTVVGTKCITDVENKNQSICVETEFTSSGSGAIVHQTKDETSILTAAHVCLYDLPKEIQKEFDKIERKYKIQTSDKKIREVYLRKISPGFKENKGIDLCLLNSPKLNFPKLHLSSEAPKLGERIYNMASPHGSYNPPAPIMFSGHYSGENENGPECIVTLPSAPGSSGSPLLNSRGELVGLVFAVNMELSTLTMCVKYKTLKQFLDSSL